MGGVTTYRTGEDGSSASIEMVVNHLASDAADATVVEISISDLTEVRIGAITSSDASVSWVVSVAGDTATVEFPTSANLSVSLEGVDDVVDDGDIPFTILVQSGSRLTGQSAYGISGDIHASLNFSLAGINLDNDTSGEWSRKTHMFLLHTLILPSLCVLLLCLRCEIRTNKWLIVLLQASSRCK